MSYTKHTWEPGEFITSEWLNHMEEGIEQADAAAGNTVAPEQVLEYLGITDNQQTTNTGT